MNRVSTRPNAGKDEIVMPAGMVDRSYIGRVIRPHAATFRWFEPGRVAQVFDAMNDAREAHRAKAPLNGSHIVLILTGTHVAIGAGTGELKKVPLNVDDLVIVSPEEKNL